MQQHIPESSAKILPILSRFKDQAKKTYGQRLKNIILYGSYAKGTAKQDSDIDLMIVLSEMESAFNEIDRLNARSVDPSQMSQGIQISATKSCESELSSHHLCDQDKPLRRCIHHVVLL